MTPSKRKAPEAETPDKFAEATELMAEQIRLIAAKSKQMGKLAGNPNGTNYSRRAVEECRVCGARKHSVKWGETRCVEKTQEPLPRGTVCYACVRATLALGANCRSFQVLSQIEGVLQVWRNQSKIKRAKLHAYSGDCCVCSLCQAEKAE